VRCLGCGHPALKTVRWRRGVAKRAFNLCDRCYPPLAGSVWLVRGPVSVFGVCRGCGEWLSVRDLAETTPGGKWDALLGSCPGCRIESCTSAG